MGGSQQTGWRGGWCLGFSGFWRGGKEVAAVSAMMEYCFWWTGLEIVWFINTMGQSLTFCSKQVMAKLLQFYGRPVVHRDAVESKYLYSDLYSTTFISPRQTKWGWWVLVSACPTICLPVPASVTCPIPQDLDLEGSIKIICAKTLCIWWQH